MIHPIKCIFTRIKMFEVFIKTSKTKNLCHYYTVHRLLKRNKNLIVFKKYTICIFSHGIEVSIIY